MSEFKNYIGCKIVLARPMSRAEYNEFRGWAVPENENPNDAGYLVEYTDSAPQPELLGKAEGYTSWSPKDVFEKSYVLTAENVVSYAIAKEGSIYVGHGNTLEEAKDAAESVEKSEELTAPFSFSMALQLCQAGAKIARTGWNGKGMYVTLIQGCTVSSAVNEVYGDPDEEPTPVNDFLMLYTAQGKLSTWVPSVTDLLADDWEVV